MAENDEREVIRIDEDSDDVVRVVLGESSEERTDEVVDDTPKQDEPGAASIEKTVNEQAISEAPDESNVDEAPDDAVEGEEVDEVSGEAASGDEKPAVDKAATDDKTTSNEDAAVDEAAENEAATDDEAAPEDAASDDMTVDADDEANAKDTAADDATAEDMQASDETPTAQSAERSIERPDAAARASSENADEPVDVLSDMDPAFKRVYEILRRIVDNVETVIYGKRSVIELVLLAIVARGHVLIEDVPGVGKTSLISALAKSLSCDFHRIQFTPDVMPSDVTGFSIFNQKTREFEFRPGGVMANIVLADEINRASAKTQSSLLEAMEERQVTVDAHTYKLEEPFMVLATENPLEQFGTYPLPEAQIDRFLIKTSVGYPAFDQEMRIIDENRAAKLAIRPVASRDDIITACNMAEKVHLCGQIERYIVEIVTSTRNSTDIEIGSSPRGTIALADLSRAWALYQGRSYVIPDDIKYLVPPALGHRIALSHDATVEGRTPEAVLTSLLSGIAVPITAEEARREAAGAAKS